MAKPTNKKHHRTAQLAQIHIAKAQLGLDDDTYRGVIRLISNNRTDSSAQLDYAERNKLLDHFKARGFKNTIPARGIPTSVEAKASNAGVKSSKPTSRAEVAPLVSKVGALLADMQLSWSYADGIAKRMYNRDRLQWCEPDELRGVITALVKKQSKHPQGACPTSLNAKASSRLPRQAEVSK